MVGGSGTRLEKKEMERKREARESEEKWVSSTLKNVVV